MSKPINDLTIDTHKLHINELKVKHLKTQFKSNKERLANTLIIMPDNRQFKVSNRFWNSFSSLFTLGTSLFDYFSYDEVFRRITEKKSDQVRVTVECEPTTASDGTLVSGTMLSCTSPSKPILKMDEVKSIITFNNGEHAVYDTGIVQASFAAPYPENFAIGNGNFTTRFMLVLPVDGYGLPSAYLELQRDTTKAIITGASKAFRTQFQLGKNDTGLTSVLERAMTTFNNEEGYHTFKLRLEAATKSWASFSEAGELHHLIESVLTADGFEIDLKRSILNRFNDAVGNPLSYYGVAGANELSKRKAKTIPVKATIFDLFNFVTEINTHYIKTRGGRQKLNEWVGIKIAEEYDLENTVETNPEFKDFFLGTTKGIVDSMAGVGDRVLDLSDGPLVEDTVAAASDASDATEIPTEPAKTLSCEYVPAAIDNMPNDMILLWMNHAAIALSCGKQPVALPAPEIIEPIPEPEVVATPVIPDEDTGEVYTIPETGEVVDFSNYVPDAE